MKIDETENCYIIKNIFNDDFIVGYTKPILLGSLPEILRIIVSDIKSRDISIAYMSQVHGGETSVINSAGEYVCDGLATDSRNILLCVKTADCLPILYWDNSTDRVGLAHMGWKGAAEGIITTLPINFLTTNFFLGVGLRGCCYQVSDDFKRNKLFDGYINCLSGALFFDVIAFTREKLMANGVDSKNIFDLGECSLHSEKHFPSYRRDATVNRTVSFIAKL